MKVVEYQKGLEKWEVQKKRQEKYEQKRRYNRNYQEHAQNASAYNGKQTTTQGKIRTATTIPGKASDH